MISENPILIEDAICWAYTHGIVSGSKLDENNDNSFLTAIHTPFSLRPYSFPKKSFDKAVSLAYLFNTLVDEVSKDREWLENALKLVRNSRNI